MCMAESDGQGGNEKDRPYRSVKDKTTGRIFPARRLSPGA